jgi:hypothetical protein
MYPVNISFSRKQIAQVVGTTDDVLGYWMREGLLVPTSGGSGKGSHRSFDYRQVHTAAILHELRGLGVNIAGLKWFASTIQRGITLADSLNASGRELLYASYIAMDDPGGRASTSWKLLIISICDANFPAGTPK